MSDRNPARELADSGTPAPWYALPADDTFNPSVGSVPESTPSMLTSDEWVAECNPHGVGDAAKIVRAVNALTAIADLLDAIRDHRLYSTIDETAECDYCCKASVDGQCSVVDDAARAVEAALRGDGGAPPWLENHPQEST
jgi:hypothetical protein